MKTIRDGSAVFTVRDKRMQAMVDMFYPIGSVYISADKSKTKADFPFMQYGTWEEVPANLCLQTGDVSEAGTPRSAGLPNITGELAMDRVGYQLSNDVYAKGALFSNSTTANLPNNGAAAYVTDKNKHPKTFYFDASKSNSIYGASDTVQPPAYMVRAWVRTA